MSEQLDRIEAAVNELRSDVGEMKLHITGGRTPERGLILRVDRIEQTSKWQSWLARSFIGAAIIALVSGFAQKFGFGGGGQ